MKFNNVVTRPRIDYSHSTPRPTWACSASRADGDVHRYTRPAMTIARNPSITTGQDASSAAASRAARCPSTPRSIDTLARTRAEHRAIRFLSFNQDALALLQSTESDLQAQLGFIGDASGAHAQDRRADLAAQLARVRREILLAVRGRHRAVAQLRAAEAKAGHHHHHSHQVYDRWARLGAARARASRDASADGAFTTDEHTRVRGASCFTLATRCRSHRARAARAYLRFATAQPSPSAARRDWVRSFSPPCPPACRVGSLPSVTRSARSPTASGAVGNRPHVTARPTLRCACSPMLQLWACSGRTCTSASTNTLYPTKQSR